MKKLTVLLSILLCFCMGITVCATLLGDVDNDGKITFKDLCCLAEYITGNSSVVTTANSDMNSDGKLTLKDLRLLFKTICSKDESDTLSEAQIEVFKINASAGETVDVTVSLHNNPGIFDMILSFTYDGSAMKLKSVKNADVLSDAVFVAPKNMSSGCRASWYYMDEPEKYPDGALTTLTFEIFDTAAPGDYPITVLYGDGDIHDYSGNNLAFKVIPGIVTVNTSSHNHTPEAAASENVVVGTCKTEGTCDEVIYCGICGEEISRVKKSSGYGEHHYVNGKCEYCGQSETTTDAFFEVSSADASAGDTVAITVSIKNNPGIFNMILGFSYDSSVMKLKSVKNADVLSSAVFVAPKNMSSGCRASWYYMDEPEEYPDGAVVTLTFEVLDEAIIGEYPITVVYENDDIQDYAENSLSPLIKSGKLKIR